MKKKLLINDVIFPGIYELKNQDSTARRFRDRRLMDLWESNSLEEHSYKWRYPKMKMKNEIQKEEDNNYWQLSLEEINDRETSN